MDVRDRARVCAAFCVSSAYYGRDISDVVARMYQADLDDLDADDVLAALHALRRDPKRRSCPLPSEVRAYLHQDNTQDAPEQLAAKVSAAIKDYGYTRPHAARAHLGEQAWQAVQQLGGWVGICQRIKASELGTFTAQVRELCRANQERATTYFGSDRQLGSHLEPKVAELLQNTVGALSAANERTAANHLAAGATFGGHQRS